MRTLWAIIPNYSVNGVSAFFDKSIKAFRDKEASYRGDCTVVEFLEAESLRQELERHKKALEKCREQRNSYAGSCFYGCDASTVEAQDAEKDDAEIEAILDKKN